MERLAGLFPERIRSRARGYVRSEKIRLLEEGDTLLLAEVTGTEHYLTAFRRSGRTLYYGCTCPFFTEGLAGCKHQWALVREAAESTLVRRAGECKAFIPSSTCVHGEPEEPPVGDAGDPEGLESLTAQLARSILRAV